MSQLSPINHDKPSKVKSLPVKLGRKIKSLFHHVPTLKHHKHKAEKAPETLPFLVTTATWATPVFPSLYVGRDVVPTSQKSEYIKDSFIHSDLGDSDSSGDTTVTSDRSSQSSISSIAEIPADFSHTQDVSFATAMTSLTDDLDSGEPRQAPESSSISSRPADASQAEERLLISSESIHSSPPAVYIEAEVPDPFLIDDEDDPVSENDEDVRAVAAVSESQQTITPAHEISLTSDPIPSHPTVPPPNLNKDVPPPHPINESDEDETPDLYFPGLILPTMFLPIPNTDPLAALLTKYIPPEKRPVRDITGDWQRSDFHTLVMTNSWRALARMARDRIVASDPEDLALILGLWYLRLASLARLRLFNQTSVECTNLFVVLNGIEPLEARKYVFDRILPFELEVMQTRLKYWSGDPMGYLDALNALLSKCRTKARSATSGDTVSMWKERGARISLIIASQMVEMKEYSAATKLLEPLCRQDDAVSTASLRSSVARIYLQSGNVPMAAKQFAIVDEDPATDQAMKDMNAALLASAEGDWTRASSILRRILEEDAENFVAINNLSVALLSQGKLKESIEILGTALKASPASVVIAEPFLFNLATLYELRSVTAIENKRNLLIEVAKWSGDGLKTTCLKMPTNS